MNIFKKSESKGSFLSKIPWGSNLNVSAALTTNTENGMENNNNFQQPLDTFENGFTVFTTMEFFECYIQSPLPHNLTTSHILAVSIQLLQDARIDVKDFVIQDNANGGTISINNRAQHLLKFINTEKVGKGYIKLLDEFMKESQYAEEIFHPSNQIEDQESNYMENYVKNIADIYYAIMHANRSPTPTAPTELELELMTTLNLPDTLKVSNDFLSKLAELEMEPRISKKRMTLIHGMLEKQDTVLLYNDFSPKIVSWLTAVLGIQFDPKHDLLYILRSGDILCRLLTALYPTLNCALLQKGYEYAIHKIVFFLEFCKYLHIKRSLLFRIDDIMVRSDADTKRKSALIVVRAIIALEKHARKNGWDGPSIGLKSTTSKDLGVGTIRESIIQEHISHFMSIPVSATPSTDAVSISEVPTHPLAIVSSVATNTPPIIEGSQFSSKEAPTPIDKDDHFMENNIKSQSILDDGMVPDVEIAQSKDQGTNTSADEIMEDAIDKYISMIERRNKFIEDFIAEEQTYIHYLNSLVTYVGQLIEKRKKGYPALSTLDDGAISTMMRNSPTFTLSSSPLPQHPSESDGAYSVRLENEITELQSVLDLLERFVGVHSQFANLVSRSRKVLDPLPNKSATYTTFIISPGTTEFINALQNPYVTFAVLVVSSLGEHIKFSTKKEHQIVESVAQYIKQGDSTDNSDEEPTSREWRVFLFHAIERLCQYRTLFDQISQEGLLFQDVKIGTEVYRDDLKLRKTAARIGCIYDSILDYFNL